MKFALAFSELREIWATLESREACWAYKQLESYGLHLDNDESRPRCSSSCISDLIQSTITRLTGRCCRYAFDGRPFSTHVEMSLIGTVAVTNMPSTFTSNQEAEAYFFLIIRRALHFLNAQVAHTINTNTDISSLDAINIHRNEEWQLLSSAGMDKYLHELYRWSAAFQPLLIEASKDKMASEYKRALVLDNYTKSTISTFAGEIRHDVQAPCPFHPSASNHCSRATVARSPTGLNIMRLPCLAKI